MIPEKTRLLGLDTPEGRERFDRLSRLRDSGWTGPVDQDGRAVMSRTDSRGRPLPLFEGGTGARTPDDPRMRDPRRPARSRAQVAEGNQRHVRETLRERDPAFARAIATVVRERSEPRDARPQQRQGRTR